MSVAEKVGVKPLTPLLEASFKVIVTVEVATPLAVTGPVPVIVELAAFTVPAVNVIAWVWVIVTESVVSVAVKTGTPVVDESTVKVATPKAFEVPETTEMVSVAPREEARETDFPETRLPEMSLSVQVTVTVLTPSA